MDRERGREIDGRGGRGKGMEKTNLETRNIKQCFEIV